MERRVIDAGGDEVGRGEGVMFPELDTEGGPVRRPNLLRRSFLPLLKKTGLPRIRFHDLRHTAATLLLQLAPRSQAGPGTHFNPRPPAPVKAT